MKDPFNRLSCGFSDPTAGILSDEQRANLDNLKVYPKPHTCLVGIKGDDVFRVYASCHYGIENAFRGRSFFRVSGFEPGANISSKPLPPEVDRLFDVVKDSNKYLFGSK